MQLGVNESREKGGQSDGKSKSLARSASQALRNIDYTQHSELDSVQRLIDIRIEYQEAKTEYRRLAASHLEERSHATIRCLLFGRAAVPTQSLTTILAHDLFCVQHRCGQRTIWSFENMQSRQSDAACH